MQQLVVQAAGLFVYAATVVKYLEQKEYLDMLPSVSKSAIPQTSEEETPLFDNLYLQVLSDSLCGFKGNFFHRLQILHTFFCTVERTLTSLVAKLFFPSNETNPAFLYSTIADSISVRLHA